MSGQAEAGKLERGHSDIRLRSRSLAIAAVLVPLGVLSVLGPILVAGPAGAANRPLAGASGNTHRVVAKPFTFLLGPINSLTLTPSTATPTAGTPFTVSMTAYDALGNVDTDYTGTQCLSFSGPLSSPNATAPSYPAQGSCSSSSSSAVTFVNGVATGTDAASITLTDASDNPVTLTATDVPSGATGSTTLNVSPSTLNSLSLSPSTSTPTAGAAFTVAMTGYDAYGNTATGYSGSECIDFSGPLSSPNATAPSYPAQGSCSSSSSSAVTFVSGVASGSDAASVTLTDASDNPVTLTATDHPSGADGSTSLTVSPATASQLGFVPSAPGPATAGVAIPNVEVAVQDAYGNTVTSVSSGSVVMSIASGPQGTFTSGTTTVPVSSGVATFTDLVVDTSGSYTLTASPSGITGVTSPVNSGSFSVVSSAVASLALTPSTSTPTAGTPFTVSLTALDAYGNTVTRFNGQRCVDFSGPLSSPNATAPSYPAQGTCSSSSSSAVTFVNGVASGSHAASITLYDASHNPVTLTATAHRTGSTGSTTLTVGSAGIASLSLTPSTSTPTAGTAFTVSLTALDAYGNTVTRFNGQRCIDFSGPLSSPNATAPSYPAQGTCSSSSSSAVTFVSGVASGANAASVTLTDASDNPVTLTATTHTTAKSGSATLNVSPATIASLALTPSQANPTAGTSFTLSMTAYDAYGNVATGYSGTQCIDFSGPLASPYASPIYPAQGSCPSSSSSAVTFVSGVASGANAATVTLVDSADNPVTLTATDHPSGATGSTTLNVSPATSTSALTTSVNPAAYGATATLTDTVTGNSVLGYPTGTVDFTDSSYNPLTCAAGSDATLTPAIGSSPPQSTATCLYAPTGVGGIGGQFALLATSSGDAAYASSQGALTQYELGSATTLTATLLFGANPDPNGTPVTISGTWTDGSSTDNPADSTNALPPVVNIVNQAGHASICSNVALTQTGTYTASFSCTYTPSGPGAKITMRVIYSGNATFAAASYSSNLVVAGTASSTVAVSVNPTSVVQGSASTLTAVVSGSSGVPTGSVTFYDNGSPVASCAGRLVASSGSGKATCSYTSATTGSQPITAVYNGDPTYAASGPSAPATLFVTGNGSSTAALASSANPNAYGTGATLTDTVTGSLSGVPTGSVTFTATVGSSTTTVCANVPLTPTTGTSAQAQCFYDPTVSGNLGQAATITATYSGDTTYAAETQTITQTELGNNVPGMTITSNRNPATSGTAVTFTVKLTGSSTPTGTVSFYDNGSLIAACSALRVASGRVACSYTVSSANGTSQTILAVYSGDPTYRSAQQSLTQTVNP